MKLLFSVLLMGATTALAPSSAGAAAAGLATGEEAAAIAGLRDVTVKNGEVSGEVVNRSKHGLREVQLQILYSWRWKDELHPGTNDPGRAVYYLLARDIAPGQSARFNYQPSPPLPARDDGMFEISVKIVGFAQVSF